jgi:hypothetical protein
MRVRFDLSELMKAAGSVSMHYQSLVLYMEQPTWTTKYCAKESKVSKSIVERNKRETRRTSEGITATIAFGIAICILKNVCTIAFDFASADAKAGRVGLDLYE